MPIDRGWGGGVLELALERKAVVELRVTGLEVVNCVHGPNLSLYCSVLRINTLVGTFKGNRTLGKYRHRWEDNIKVDVFEVSCADVD
jgi:hypothetical protein